MTLLTRLLLLNPGTIQTHPDAGVGLVERYRYAMEGSEVQLQSDIRVQIDKYLPQFTGSNVTVKFKDHSFLILITFENMVFAYMYDINSSELTQQFTTLDNIS